VIDQDGKTQYLAYKIIRETNIIEFHPNEPGYFVDIIYLEGFNSIPDEFSENGYILASVQYYLNTAFKDMSIAKFTISKLRSNSLRKSKNGYHIVIAYEQFANYKQEMTDITTEAKAERRITTNSFLSMTIPSLFPPTAIPASRKKNRFMQNIDPTIIPLLTKHDLKIIEDFTSSLINGRYISSPSKIRLLTEYKESIDSIALKEAISRYKLNYKNEVNESEWGKYLKQYLFLLDSKYVKVIPELNVALATWRKVDFGLVDFQGFLDIYEIKKPTTNLLCSTTDRGNYYWHTDMAKAIVQAEKYLYSCERKAADIAEAIKREYDYNVKVIKPRAVLVAGHSTQFEGKNNMEEDFRILRSSLKNIEIILYDELYERLLAQQKRSYIEITSEPEISGEILEI
jgi:hypothetical protein